MRVSAYLEENLISYNCCEPLVAQKVNAIQLLIAKGCIYS